MSSVLVGFLVCFCLFVIPIIFGCGTRGVMHVGVQVVHASHNAPSGSFPTLFHLEWCFPFCRKT